MKKCAICGEPVESGYVIHKECCPHWRSVKDDPPEKHDLVIVTDGAAVDTMSLQNDGTFAFGNGFLFEAPTYWMPLPTPPPEE